MKFSAFIPLGDEPFADGMRLAADVKIVNEGARVPLLAAFDVTKVIGAATFCKSPDGKFLQIEVDAQIEKLADLKFSFSGMSLKSVNDDITEFKVIAISTVP